MNKLLLLQSYMRTALIITIMASAAPLLQAAPSHAQALEKRLSATYNNMPLREVILDLQERTKTDFGFTRELYLDDIWVRSKRFKDEKLRHVLQDLFKGHDINFEEKAGAIVLSRMQQPGRITGRVTDDNGEPLAGVSVRVVELNRMVTTDANGDFRISIPPGTYQMEFFFISYARATLSGIKVVSGEETVQNVALKPSVSELDEVVVTTALGLKRAARSLGYSVGEVKAEDITKVPHENVVNSLNARVPGVRVINTNNDINSEPIVFIRGFTSLSGGNSPLVVVDGMPTGNDISVLSDLNADNVESISVLKGPSAAALYGSRAGSGVLLVTTKSGNKEKGLGVNFSTSYNATVPYKFIPLQQRFASGMNGNFDETNSRWWGPEMGTSVARFGTDGVATPLTANPDNVSDFVNTGNSFINDVSIVNSTDKWNFNLSLSDIRSTGIYPESNVSKNAVSLAASYKITDKLKIGGNFNFLNSGSDNYRSQSNNNYPYEDLYFTPNWLNINDLKSYWQVADEQQDVWAAGFNNPWFTVNESINSFRKIRPYGQVNLNWDITNELSLMARVGSFNEEFVTENRSALSEKNQPNGTYAHIARSSQEINTDFLLNYKKGIQDFSFDVSAGGNLLFQNNEAAIIGGNNLVLPGLYTANNIDRSAVDYQTPKANKRINSIYGMASVGYKDALYLELSGRNDWSSTLPINNRSYFYPSASLSMLFSELFELPGFVSLAKLRGGWAMVGKDTSPYALSMTLNRATWGNQTVYSLPAVTPTNNLLPQSITSTELGLDLSFFKNRLGLDLTYYEVEDRDQITRISISGTTGHIGANVNAGAVRNKGIEVALKAVPVQTQNVLWDMVFNFTKERSKLIALPSGVSNYQFWSRNDIYNQTTLDGDVGDLWGPDILRVTEGEYAGWALLDGNGYVQENTNHIKLGNVMPDFTLGFQTNFSYKRATLSASFDWRQGGDYYSESMLRLARDGRGEGWYKGDGSSTFTGILSNNSFNGDNAALANEIRSNPGRYGAQDGLIYVGGRNAELGGFDYGGPIANGVFFPGVISDGNGGYTENFGETGTKYFPVEEATGTYWDRGVQTWVYDASFIKLRELAIAYRLPDKIAHSIAGKQLTVSGFLKNVIIWTKAKNHVDPESTMVNSNDQFSSARNYQLGWDRASFYPWTATLGLRLNVTF